MNALPGETLFLVYGYFSGTREDWRLLSSVASRDGYRAFRIAYRDARTYVRPGAGWGYHASRVVALGRIVAEAFRPAGV